MIVKIKVVFSTGKLPGHWLSDTDNLIGVQGLKTPVFKISIVITAQLNIDENPKRWGI